MKGFGSQAQTDPYLAEARHLGATALLFDDTGFDLGVYFAAASLLRRERYCFLNSFSEPLAEGWLAALDGALSGQSVGLVSATGSWNSSRSWLLYSLRMPSVYTSILPSRAVVRAHFAEIPDGGADTTPGPPSAAVRMARGLLKAASQLPTQMREFEPFPAHHLRTNCLMVDHATLAELHLHEVRVKADAYALESGRRSLTRQVQQMGLRTVVVDRRGRLYDQDRWHESRTFWQGSQEQLWVADNQTRQYQRADMERRALLSALAWGADADPRPGTEG